MKPPCVAGRRGAKRGGSTGRSAVKQDPDRRFHALFDKVARSVVMVRAWGDVRANKGAPGLGGISIDDAETLGVQVFLEAPAEDLRSGRYRPRPLRRVHIPKPGRPGSTRPPASHPQVTPRPYDDRLSVVRVP